MSERLHLPPVVAVRDRASGRYLASGSSWSIEPEAALLLDEAEARTLLGRFACEPEAIELVARGRADDAA